LYFMDSGPNYYSDPKIIFEWHGEGLDDDDILWLEDELLNCTTSNKIVLMHHPAVGEAQDLFIKNKDSFVQLCENNNVDIVLAGHTHNDKIYDYDLNKYDNRPLNCSNYSTLYVQSDDCKEGMHYRNISFINEHFFIGESVELSNTVDIKSESYVYENIYFNVLEKKFLNVYN